MSSFTTISNQPGRARRFVLLTLGLAGAVTLALALLNYFIDPYGRFGTNRFGVFISAERTAKPTLLRRYPHDALLVGDSKCGMIPAGELSGYRFFNASFAGASAEEEYYCIKHFAIGQKLVVLEVDFLQCDPPANKGDLFASPDVTSVLNSLFSAKSVEYSIRTITGHFRGAPSSLAPDGTAESAGWFRLYDRQDNPQLRWKLNNVMRSCDRFAPGWRLSFYRKIGQLLRERGVPCVAFVPPLHQAVVDHLKTSPNQNVINLWRDEVREIFPNLVDLSMGPYDDPENFFKTDPLHFKPGVGVRLLNESVIPAVQR